MATTVQLEVVVGGDVSPQDVEAALAGLGHRARHGLLTGGGRPARAVFQLSGGDRLVRGQALAARLRERGFDVTVTVSR